VHLCHTKRMADALQTAQAGKVEDAHGRAVQAGGACMTCSHLSIHPAVPLCSRPVAENSMSVTRLEYRSAYALTSFHGVHEVRRLLQLLRVHPAADHVAQPLGVAQQQAPGADHLRSAPS
jgi:hypothetical protein